MFVVCCLLCDVCCCGFAVLFRCCALMSIVVRCVLLVVSWLLFAAVFVVRFVLGGVCCLMYRCLMIVECCECLVGCCVVVRVCCLVLRVWSVVCCALFVCVVCCVFLQVVGYLFDVAV